MKRFNDYSTEQHQALLNTWSDQVDTIVATGASQAVTVKVADSTTADCVAFSSTGNFYVKFANGGTAVIPVATVTNGTASILNPTTRYLDGLTSFAVIAAAGTIINIQWYL